MPTRRGLDLPSLTLCVICSVIESMNGLARAAADTSLPGLDSLIGAVEDEADVLRAGSVMLDAIPWRTTLGASRYLYWLLV